MWQSSKSITENLLFQINFVTFHLFPGEIRHRVQVDLKTTTKMYTTVIPEAGNSIHTIVFLLWALLSNYISSFTFYFHKAEIGNME